MLKNNRQSNLKILNFDIIFDKRYEIQNNLVK